MNGPSPLGNGNVMPQKSPVTGNKTPEHVQTAIDRLKANPVVAAALKRNSDRYNIGRTSKGKPVEQKKAPVQSFYEVEKPEVKPVFDKDGNILHWQNVENPDEE
jgi:hypothetical protein